VHIVLYVVATIAAGRLGVLVFFVVTFMYMLRYDVQGWGGVGC
jgi:hypothetical protein